MNDALVTANTSDSVPPVRSARNHIAHDLRLQRDEDDEADYDERAGPNHLATLVFLALRLSLYAADTILELGHSTLGTRKQKHGYTNDNSDYSYELGGHGRTLPCNDDSIYT